MSAYNGCQTPKEEAEKNNLPTVLKTTEPATTYNVCQTPKEEAEKNNLPTSKRCMLDILGNIWINKIQNHKCRNKIDKCKCVLRHWFRSYKINVKNCINRYLTL